MRLDDPVAGLCIFFLLESILSRRPAAVLFLLSTFPWVDAHMAGMAGKVLLPEEAAGPGQYRRRGRVGSSAWRALRRIDFFYGAMDGMLGCHVCFHFVQDWILRLLRWHTSIRIPRHGFA